MYKFFVSAWILFFSSHLVFSQTSPSLSSGLARQKEGKHELAIADFSEAIKKHDAEVQTFLIKWDEYEKITPFERAEKGIEAPPVEPAFAKAYYLRGVSYAAMKKNDEAIKDLTIAIKVNPKLSAAYLERGKLLWSTGSKFEGCSDLGTARSLGDSLAKEAYDEKFCWNDALGFYKEALSKLKLNMYESGLELIQKSIQLSPDSASFYAVRGKCYLGLGRLDLAFTDFNRAIAASTTNSEAYFGRGVAFYTKRQFQEAFDDLDKAISLNAKLTDAYLYRAYVCEGMNKMQSALYDYQQVQRLKPNDPLAFYKSGLLKNDSGDPKAACIDFKKAASMGHTDAAEYAKNCK